MLWKIFIDNLKIGALAWGGPATQIEMLRRYAAEKQKCLNHEEFKKLLGICQILPGPEAAEMAIFIGKKIGGGIGGFLAGLAFFLPNFVLLLLASWLYFTYATSHGTVQVLLAGIRPAIVSIILYMGYKLSKIIIADGPRRITIAAVAMFLVFFTPLDPLFIMLFLGGVYFIWKVKRMPKASGTHLSSVGFLGIITASLPVVVFLSILKIGALSFGGANTVVPLLYDVSVREHQWITHQVFLDGIAINEIIPGPLVMIAAFVGYAVLGPFGAFLGTLAIALPAFILVLGFGNKLAMLAQHPDVAVYLQGLLAAVMGILASFAITLASHVLNSVSAWLIAIIALVLLVRWKLHPGVAIGIGVLGSIIQYVTVS